MRGIVYLGADGELLFRMVRDGTLSEPCVISDEDDRYEHLPSTKLEVVEVEDDNEHCIWMFKSLYCISIGCDDAPADIHTVPDEVIMEALALPEPAAQ